MLDVLRYGHSKRVDVLSCLKFFDWVGRQQGFRHTQCSFYAVFKILSSAKLMSVMIDFLQSFVNPRLCHERIRFYNVLVIGYAVAGKPYVALQEFGKMRYGGLDLDEFSYNVFLNALVEQGCFEAVDAVFGHICARGLVSDVTRAVMFKSLCKRKKFDEAEVYLDSLTAEGKLVDARSFGAFVFSLCSCGRFEEAGRLMDKFQYLGVKSLNVAYGVWIRHLVKAKKLDGALEFLKSKRTTEGYVPDVFKYNFLLSSFLRKNRLVEVFDLLAEMKECNILPDKFTMNMALCFFCKAGMVDVVQELYDYRSELELSPSVVVYNYLINTLCGHGKVEEAFYVWKDSVDQGLLPGGRTFYLLADSLYKQKKMDKMRELLDIALRLDFMPSDRTYDHFIVGLCSVNMLHDGYLVYEELMRKNKAPGRTAFFWLIRTFIKSNKAHLAPRLLIQMQQVGHRPTALLVRDVICNILQMKDSEERFRQLLKMQISLVQTDLDIYSSYINGAGYARRPDLARLVYELMQANGIESDLSIDTSMLRGYLKGGQISNGLNFFYDLGEKRHCNKKLYNIMIIGLCDANKVDTALELALELNRLGKSPSRQCYENIIKLLCDARRFDEVVYLIRWLEKQGFRLTTYIGNVLLFNSMKNRELYDAWNRWRYMSNEMSQDSLFGQLIGIFSGFVQFNGDVENLDEAIEQCFPINLYTYNLLLMLSSRGGMSCVYKMYNRLCRKGYRPNQWTYHVLIRCLHNSETTAESQRLIRELMWKRDNFDDQTNHVLGLSREELQSSFSYKVFARDNLMGDS